MKSIIRLDYRAYFMNFDDCTVDGIRHERARITYEPKEAQTFNSGHEVDEVVQKLRKIYVDPIIEVIGI